MTDTYDVIVIGAGPAGENAAQYAIQGSDRTAVLVEHELVGGECSYWACIPSKALLRPWEVLSAAQDLPPVASLVKGGRVDVAATLARRDSFVHDLSDSGQVDWASSQRIDVVRGTGRISGEKTVVVNGSDGSERRLSARRAVVLATGTAASVPPVPGLREAMPWISRDVTNLHQVPDRIVIIGGGVVACEAATWLQSLGAEVTMIVQGSALLERNEPFAGEMVADRFGELGITVHLNAAADKVERTDARDTGYGHVHGGKVVVHFADQSVTADEVLVAAGRNPATAELGLDSVGLAQAVKDNHGFVPVDEHLTVTGVSGDWLYAVGDLNGLALLTHMGKYQARIAGAVIAARAEGKSVDGPWYTDQSSSSQVPQVTFTDPEVASVGLTEQQARDAGSDVEGVEYDLGAVSGTSLQRDNYKGRAKLVVDSATETLVGATFVGPEVADLVHQATIALVGKVPLPVLWHAVPSYPTPSEVWLRLLEKHFNPK